MNYDSINIIGFKQNARVEVTIYLVKDVEGLIETLDGDFEQWSDFDSWENIKVQQWIFQRAIDVYQGKKIDIKCDCCEFLNLIPTNLEESCNKNCYGIKSAYMIKKVANEIALAKAKRESDGTYSA